MCLACGRGGPVAAELAFGSCRCVLVGGEALSVFRAVQKHLVAQSLWSIFVFLSPLCDGMHFVLANCIN